MVIVVARGMATGFPAERLAVGGARSPAVRRFRDVSSTVVTITVPASAMVAGGVDGLGARI